MIYRFFINGTEWAENGNISGWSNLKRTIQRVSSNGEGVLITADGELRFHGDLYDFFLNEFTTGSICKDYDIVILETLNGTTYRDFYRGKIFLSDFEFDFRIKTAKTTIQDNSFYSRINNNKSIKTSPVSGRSKNDTAITPCNVWTLQTFICDTGVAYNTVEAIRVYELLEYLVSFMTDGQMMFKSDVFDIGGEFEGAFVTTGLSLRTQEFADIPFEVSWAECMDELYKNFNIAFEIETDLQTLSPVMRVERQQDLYINTIVHSFDSPLNLKLRYKKERNYSKVIIGSMITSEPQQTYLPFPEELNLVSFKQEEYIILGQCNIDSELNLVRSWIVSSNIIFDINYHLSEEHDDSVAMIMCDSININTLQAVAEKTNTLTGASAPLFYNEKLYSSNCLLRFYGAIPNSIIKYLGNNNNTFLATVSPAQLHTAITSPVTIEPYPFSNDSIAPGYDAGGNYNNSTYRFTAPSNGMYSFTTEVQYQAVITRHRAGFIRFTIKRYNSSNVLISSASSNPVVHDNVSNSTKIYYGTITESMTTVMSAGDYVVVSMRVSSGGTSPGSMTLTVKTQSYFACTNSENYGGVFQTVDPKDYRAISIEFESDVTQDEIEKILENKKGKYAVLYDNQQYEGWIEKCTLYSNHQRQTAEIILTTSLNFIN